MTKPAKDSTDNPTRNRMAARLMKLPQVTEEYGIPYTSACDLVKRGTLPCVRFPAKSGDTRDA